MISQNRNNVYFAVFYFLIAVGLLIYGFIVKSSYLLIASIIVSIIDFYWVSKAIIMGKKR